MAAKGYERPDPQQPHVRTAAFCFITERASIEPTQHWIRKAGERLRGVCRANRAVALMAPEESVEIGDNESLNR